MKLTMKLTKGIISRADALKISKDYVAYAEGNIDKWDTIITPFNALKVGQNVVTFTNGQFVLAKVSSINHKDFRAVDGPVVRVSNGEYSWRVDGDKYAFPA